MLEQLHYGPFYQEVSRIIENQSLAAWCLSMLACILMFTLISWTLFISDDKIKKRRLNNACFLSLSVLTILIYRSLSFYAHMYNPDEAHILTPALNILSDGRLWVAADSTTLGPVNYLLIALVASILRFVGIECDITFFLVRSILALLIAGTFFFLYKICIKNISLKLTRVVLLFYVFFFSFHYDNDLQAYDSEFPFCFFFSLCIYLLYKIKMSPNYIPVIFAGFFCGILPYIKLQTLPMMFSYIIWVLYIIIDTSKNRSKDTVIRQTIKKSSIFFIAILMPTILILIYCSTYENGVSNAYLYYVKNAVARINFPLFSVSFLSYTVKFFIVFLRTWYGSLFILIMLSVFLLILVRVRLTIDCWFSCLTVLFTLFAILRPGGYFSHYMIFLSVPSLVLLIATLNALSYSKFVCPQFLDKIAYPLKKEIALSILLIISWLLIFDGFSQNVRTQTILTNKDNMVGKDKHRSTISQMIMQRTNPTDFIVVWGWEAQINIYTNRRSATAQSDIARLCKTRWGEYPHENITNYINDIQRNRPKLIVDMVAPGSFDFFEEKYSLENYKEVWDAIKDDYELTDTYPISNGSYKIYTRKNSYH
jgi:hypothetical protein